MCLLGIGVLGVRVRVGGGVVTVGSLLQLHHVKWESDGLSGGLFSRLPLWLFVCYVW